MNDGKGNIRQYAHEHVELWSSSRSKEIILLVEDDDQLRALLATVLRQDNYEVVELGNGIEALHYLAASSVYNNMLPRPNLIISDIRMPGYTGLDLLAGMAESSPQAPIILITGIQDPEVREEAGRLGATMFLTKPVDNDTLRAAVRGVLNS